MKDVCRLGSKYKRCLKDKDNKIQTETKKKSSPRQETEEKDK